MARYQVTARHRVTARCWVPGRGLTRGHSSRHWVVARDTRPRSMPCYGSMPGRWPPPHDSCHQPQSPLLNTRRSHPGHSSIPGHGSTPCHGSMPGTGPRLDTGPWLGTGRSHSSRHRAAARDTGPRLNAVLWFDARTRLDAGPRLDDEPWLNTWATARCRVPAARDTGPLFYGKDGTMPLERCMHLSDK